LVIKVLSLGKGIRCLVWPIFGNLTFRTTKLACLDISSRANIFTLSVGQGQMSVYASYMSEDDDIALGPLSQASLNEFAEVVIGGTISIPIIFYFLGH